MNLPAIYPSRLSVVLAKTRQCRYSENENGQNEPISP